MQADRAAKRANGDYASDRTEHVCEPSDALLTRQFILAARVSVTLGSKFPEAISLILRLRLRFTLPRQFSFNLQLERQTEKRAD